jgi:hypothetical protein
MIGVSTSSARKRQRRGSAIGGGKPDIERCFRLLNCTFNQVEIDWHFDPQLQIVRRRALA